MNQKQLSLFYRGVLLFFAGAWAISLLSKADQPWAKEGATIGTIIFFLAFAAFVTFITIRQFAQVWTAPVPDKPLPEGLYSDKWYHLAELAVAVSVLSTLAFVAVLLLVEPPKQCPNWRLPGKHPIPWWFVFLWSGLILAGLTFIVVRWKWVLRKAIASVDYPTTVPVSYTLIGTVFVGCAMSQFPWIEVIGRCWLGG